MSTPRAKFSSRAGFVLAAAGSAVGIGNIWGFPTQAASNGGAAFLLVYLILSFCLAYPVLMAELVIGRYARGNPVIALQAVSSGSISRTLGGLAGMLGIITVSLILSFYSIVGGWVLAYLAESLARLVGADSVAQWCITSTLPRDIFFTLLFMLCSLHIVSQGVVGGLERWSSRLMPALIVILLALIVYVLTLEGAMQGLRVYLVPDFSVVFSTSLLLKALGSAFFSLSLGVGTMLIYGSYLDDSENLPVIGGLVTLVDVSIAVLAGFLILPAMYVALHNGVDIFTADGHLLSEETMLFTVLPALFNGMGVVGLGLAIVFFLLMGIAALTSAISMLEVPVAYGMENSSMSRSTVACLVSVAIFVISLVIMSNFERLFGTVISLTTRYNQPLIGMIFCIYVGWVWNRNALLQELRQGSEAMEESFFWKVWPAYVKFACPLIILLVFLQSMLV